MDLVEMAKQVQPTGLTYLTWKKFSTRINPLANLRVEEGRV